MDLTRLVVDAVSDATVTGRDHRWQLDLPDEPVTAPGDAARLQQVLANLLANARTHTPPGTTVTTSLAAAGPGTVLLTVRDDGPGIQPELLPTVFERFAPGDSSRSRAAGSTGLGLAIVQAIVAAHAGTVEVSSRPGETAFGVELPAATTTDASRFASNGAEKQVPRSRCRPPADLIEAAQHRHTAEKIQRSTVFVHDPGVRAFAPRSTSTWPGGAVRSARPLSFSLALTLRSPTAPDALELLPPARIAPPP